MNQKVRICLVVALFMVVSLTYILPKNAFGDELIKASSASFFVKNSKSNDPEIKRLAIERVLSRYNSPLKGDAKTFVQAAYTYDIDCYMLPAIAGVESTFGRFVIKSGYNPFGWGGGRIAFESWNDSIVTVSAALRKKYIDRGAGNLTAIAHIYAPPSTGWASNVDFFMKEFYNEERKIRLMNVDL